MQPLTHCFRRLAETMKPTASRFIAGFPDEKAKSIQAHRHIVRDALLVPPVSRTAIATSFRSTVVEHYCGNAAADIETLPSDKRNYAVAYLVRVQY